MVLVNYFAISPSPLPGTYYACLIVSITLALIESLLVIAVCVYLPHISKKAIKHIVNKNNVELDTDGNAIKQKASLKRLIKIAKPVSISCSVSPCVRVSGACLQAASPCVSGAFLQTAPPHVCLVHACRQPHLVC